VEVAARGEDEKRSAHAGLTVAVVHWNLLSRDEGQDD
jgi:hypothetical protein